MRKIFFTTLLVMMMSAAIVMAAGWEQIYTDDNDNQIYFDPARVSVISRDGEDVEFSASFRMVYSERGRQALIDWYRDYSIIPMGIENLSYDVATIHFKKNGDSREYYIASRSSYTDNGVIISGMTFSNANPMWEIIPVSSLTEVEFYNALLIVDGKDFD